MEISNFTMIKETGSDPLYRTSIAEVDVTTRRLFRKRTERRRICRVGVSAYWFFMDTGEFTPGVQVECLERAYRANLEFGTP